MPLRSVPELPTLSQRSASMAPSACTPATTIDSRNPLPRVAAHTLVALIAQDSPDVVLFPSSYRARDVAGRVQALTGSTVMANAVDLPTIDRARAEILGGTTVVDVDLAGPRPHLVLMRPRSFEPAAVGGTAEVVIVDVVEPAGFVSASVLSRTDPGATGPEPRRREGRGRRGTRLGRPRGLPPARGAGRGDRRYRDRRLASRGRRRVGTLRAADRADGRHREARGVPRPASAGRCSMRSA